jgi:hypothetical protein
MYLICPVLSAGSVLNYAREVGKHGVMCALTVCSRSRGFARSHTRQHCSRSPRQLSCHEARIDNAGLTRQDFSKSLEATNRFQRRSRRMSLFFRSFTLRPSTETSGSLSY